MRSNALAPAGSHFALYEHTALYFRTVHPHSPGPQMAKGLGKSKKKSGKNNEVATLIYPPSLYIGPCSAASSTSYLNFNSITHVLSIGATPSARVPGVVYHRLPLTDSQTSSIAKTVDAAVTIIDDETSLEAGNILIHCSAAVSRSPTVVAAYLMIRYKMSLKEALGRLVLARPTISPNAGFLQQLKEMEKTLYGRVTLDIDELPRRQQDRKMLFPD